VIEAALGIDLDSSSNCSADPLECKSDPCNQEVCPMANSYVQQLLNGTEMNVKRISLLMLAFEEAEMHELLPKGFWNLVLRRQDLDEAWAKHHDADRKYKVCKEQGPPSLCNSLGGAAASASIALDNAKARYNKALKEVFPDAHAAPEDGN
jgi:hypothetical protein